MPIATDLQLPQQQRSAENLDRMLRAAEDLLNEGTFDDATVQQIVDRAGTSVGAFYSRFRNKDALFRTLQLRSLEGTLEFFYGILHNLNWRNVCAEDFVRAVVTGTAAHYREHQGVLRTLSLQARLGNSQWISEASERINTEIYRLIVDSLMCWRDAIDAKDPEGSIRLATTIVSSTLREVLIYARPRLAPVDVSHTALIGQLVETYLLCLGVDGAAQPDPDAAKKLAKRIATKQGTTSNEGDPS